MSMRRRFLGYEALIWRSKKLGWCAWVRPPHAHGDIFIQAPSFGELQALIGTEIQRDQETRKESSNG